MFGTIRRHSKWLWIIIVFGVILSFVVFFSPAQYRDISVGRTDVIGSIEGQDITRQQYLDALEESRLRFRMYSGQWPEQSQNAMFYNEAREVQSRIFLIHKIEQLGIRVGDEAIVDWVVNIFRDPETGKFSKDVYRQFMERVLQPSGITEGDFKRFARHELALQHLISVFGLSGAFVSPQEAQSLYRQQNDKVDTQAVIFSSSNFVAQVNLDEEALARFYTNRSFRYRIPERVQVSYVEFSATNYLSEAEAVLNQNTNVAQSIDIAYQQRGTNQYPGLSPEQAKAEIRKEVLNELALIEAQKRANDFAENVLEREPRTFANFEQAATELGLEVQSTEPFTRAGGPEEIGPRNEFADLAFSLSPDNPFPEQVVVGESAVYFPVFKERIPSELPPMETVRAQVVQDFVQAQAEELARQAGRGFYVTLTNEVAQGKSFEAVAAEHSVPLIDLAPVSQQATTLPGISRSDLGALKNVAFALEPGEISQFTPTTDGGFIVQVQTRVPVDDTQMQQELPKFVEELQENRRRQAFQEWLTTEMQNANIKIPGLEKEETTTS